MRGLGLPALLLEPLTLVPVPAPVPVPTDDTERLLSPCCE